MMHADDDGPVTFVVQQDLDSMSCTVRSARLADLIGAASSEALGTALILGILGLIALGIFAPEGLLMLAIVLFGGQQIVITGILILLPLAAAFRTARNYFLRLRTPIVIGLALFGAGVAALLHSPEAACLVAATILCVDLALRWFSRLTAFLNPIGIHVTAHEVQIDGLTDDRFSTAGLLVRIERTALRIGDRLVPMGAHVRWEREWLRDRILAVVHAAGAGQEDPESRQALSALTQRA